MKINPKDIQKFHKYLEIKEVERTKTNNPAHILNCLQIHKLTYFKQGDVETIEGKWVPTQNQSKGCGFGNTILTRRTLVNQFPKAYAKAKSTASPEKNLVTKPSKTTPHTTTTSVSKNIQSKEINNLKNPVVVEDPILAKTEKPVEKTIESKSENSDYTSKLESRKNTILKTIEVESKIIKVSLYDNGEIDGDSISLFFNGKLLLTNKKLTDKSISLTLPIDDENAINELVMYAENLGLIAPNTALGRLSPLQTATNIEPFTSTKHNHIEPCTTCSLTSSNPSSSICPPEKKTSQSSPQTASKRRRSRHS